MTGSDSTKQKELVFFCRREKTDGTAEGTFTLDVNFLRYTQTELTELVLNIDKQSQVTQNSDGTASWKGYTFKFITFVEG